MIDKSEAEAALNKLIADAAVAGKAIGFIHRADGSITLSVFDKSPSGTFYIGPPIQDAA